MSIKCKVKYILAAALVIIASVMIFRTILFSYRKSNEEFNFVFNYGVELDNSIIERLLTSDGKSELNTIKRTYTKDLVKDGKATTKLKLSEEEMEQVLKFILKEDVLNYPEEIKKYHLNAYPQWVSRLTIYYKGEKKTVKWLYVPDVLLDKIENVKEEDKKRYKVLEELSNMIINFTIEKEEYKKLPKENGAYL